jgi:uncharacterized membrane protein
LIGVAVIYSLAVGAISLLIVEARIAGRFGERVALRTALLAIALSAVAIYIGRFLRWNSWDVFIRPGRIVNDLATAFVGEDDPVSVLLLLVGALAGGAAYLVVRSRWRSCLIYSA